MNPKENSGSDSMVCKYFGLKYNASSALPQRQHHMITPQIYLTTLNITTKCNMTKLSRPIKHQLPGCLQ